LLQSVSVFNLFAFPIRMFASTLEGSSGSLFLLHCCIVVFPAAAAFVLKSGLIPGGGADDLILISAKLHSTAEAVFFVENQQS
jgi:hypothetical protein